MNTFRSIARKAWVLVIGLVLVVGAVACSSPSRSSSQASERSAANRSVDPLIEVSPVDADSASDDPCSVMFSNIFVAVDSISYNGYEALRLHKTVHDKEYGAQIPVSYSVLKSGGKTIATFEGVYFGAGNETNFGFASLLGGETKQLVVSQTVPRGGRQWIVDLSSNARTVFDSKEWQLGQEDVCVHDFDDDGVQEISLAITSFWGFGAMSMMESPLPSVVFKYDEKAQKYMPDKAAFARGLTDIDEDIQAIDADEELQDGLKGPYLAMRLDVFLRYVYAGRENDGWSFFDKTYNLTDKQDVKQDIKRILNTEPVYRFVYGMQPVKRQSDR